MSVEELHQESRVEYLEENPSPMARYKTEADAVEVFNTLRKAGEELYEDEQPVTFSRKENEVRAFGEDGYEVIQKSEQILETSFFESRRKAKEILENAVKNNYQTNQGMNYVS